MKILKVITVLIVVFLVSCGEDPIANFTWDPIEPHAGEEVVFSNLSTDANSYSWNFGDMSIGDEANPTHIYERSGSYIVDLRAFNGLRSDEKTVTIIVSD